MKSVVRPYMWLSISLISMLANYSAASAQQPQLEPKRPALLTAKPLAEDPSDDELRKLLKSRYNGALGEVKTVHILYSGGKVHFDRVIEAIRRLVHAGLEFHEKPAEKIGLLTQYIELAKENEKSMQERSSVGVVSVADVYLAQYERQTAEIQLLRIKRMADPR